MGCGASRAETEGGGNGREGGGSFKMMIRRRSSVHGSVVADSFTLNKQLLTNPERSKDSIPDGYEPQETKINGGGSCDVDAQRDDYVPENSILLCPGSPSFRIYCVGDDVDDDSFQGPALRRNKCQSNDNKKMRRQEAKIARIGRRIKNVRKLLINPVASGDKPPARVGD